MDIDQLLGVIDGDTCYHSSFEPILNHPKYAELVERGEEALPRMLEILQGPVGGSWVILLALRQIAGPTVLDIGPDEVGRFDLIREKWIQWGLANGHLALPMTPGQAIDVLVAKHVMGECPHELTTKASGTSYGGQILVCGSCGQQFNLQRHGAGEVIVRPYSTRVEWAWKVVEKLFDGGKVLHITRLLDGRYRVGQSRWTQGSIQGPKGRIWDDSAYEPEYVADTMPMAICVAAVDYLLPDKVQTQFEYEESMLTRVKGRTADIQERNG